MKQIECIDVEEYALDIHRDLSVQARKRLPGPPRRMDGMSLGIVTMEHNAPHRGERHPDGDEILYVISGSVRVTGDSDPGQATLLGPGDCCIVRKGEWHQVDILEPTQMLHVTPGPNGEHRPL